MDHGPWIKLPRLQLHCFWMAENRVGCSNRCFFAGSQAMPVLAWGEVSLNVMSPAGVKKIKLTHVAYVEGFFANILEVSRCKSQQIHFDSGRDPLYQGQPENVTCHLKYSKGHWLVDAPENERLSLQAFAAYMTHATERYRRPPHNPRKPIEVTPKAAHQLLGHPGRKAIEKLSENVVGIKLLGGEAPKWTDGDPCIQCKMTKQISRRPSPPFDRHFYRIGLDLN